MNEELKKLLRTTNKHLNNIGLALVWLVVVIAMSAITITLNLP